MASVPGPSTSFKEDKDEKTQEVIMSKNTVLFCDHYFFIKDSEMVSVAGPSSEAAKGFNWIYEDEDDTEFWSQICKLLIFNFMFKITMGE